MKTWFIGAAFALVAASTAYAKPGLFCRDCPFPAKIADGRWMMPNGKIRVDIDETPFGPGKNQFEVTLRAADSGAIIARGTVIQPKSRRTLTVDLIDRRGNPIKGFVRYLDADRENIQAKFTCEECSAQPLFN